MALDVKRWIVRCAILLVLPVLLAIGDGMVRPVESYTPTSVKKQKQTEQAGNQNSNEEKTPQHSKEDLAWIRDHYENLSAIFLDARLESDYIEGHIPGAYHLQFEEFFSGRPAILDFLPENELYIIYCEGGSCDSSHKVAEMLSDYGYTNTKIFEGGYPAWVDQGWDVETGKMEMGE